MTVGHGGQDSPRGHPGSTRGPRPGRLQAPEPLPQRRKRPAPSREASLPLVELPGASPSSSEGFDDGGAEHADVDRGRVARGEKERFDAVLHSRSARTTPGTGSSVKRLPTRCRKARSRPSKCASATGTPAAASASAFASASSSSAARSALLALRELGELRLDRLREPRVGSAEQDPEPPAAFLVSAEPAADTPAGDEEEARPPPKPFGTEELQRLDLGRRSEVRPAAGVEVDPLDLDEPHVALVPLREAARADGKGRHLLAVGRAGASPDGPLRILAATSSSRRTGPPA